MMKCHFLKCICFFIFTIFIVPQLQAADLYLSKSDWITLYKTHDANSDDPTNIIARFPRNTEFYATDEALKSGRREVILGKGAVYGFLNDAEIERKELKDNMSRFEFNIHYNQNINFIQGQGIFFLEGIALVDPYTVQIKVNNFWNAITLDAQKQMTEEILELWVAANYFGKDTYCVKLVNDLGFIATVCSTPTLMKPNYSEQIYNELNQNLMK